MEVPNEQQRQQPDLLHALLPPRLEDAGLEDCALPPDSIKQAFLKAASAVKSHAASILGEDSGDGCVQNPWPKDGASSDVLVGTEEESERVPGRCGVEKGGEGQRDEVVVVGGDGEGGSDEVVVGSGEVGEKGGGCVEGVKGSDIGVGVDVDIGSKEGGKGGDEAEEGENEGKKPILAEGFV